MEMITCEECLKNGTHGDGFQEVASGEDENGEFAEYECLECFHVTRVYFKENSNKF